MSVECFSSAADASLDARPASKPAKKDGSRTGDVVRHWVVVPCFNEAKRLPADAFERWLADHPQFGVLLVNDGSADDTSAVIAALAARLGGQGRAMDMPQNVGKAEAVRTGLLALLGAGSGASPASPSSALPRAQGLPSSTPAASASSTASPSGRPSLPVTVGYLDADLATPLDELPRLLAALRETPGCDIALGSRVRLLGRDIRRKPVRHYLGRCFAATASLTLGLAVYDTQCGAKLLRVDAWTRAVLAEPFGSRWIFDVELLARYLRQVRRAPRWPAEPCGIVEVPLRAWRDVAGSKLRGNDFLHAAKDLWKIGRRYRTRRAFDDKPQADGAIATTRRPGPETV